MILKLVIRNQLPRNRRKPLILIKALVEYVKIDQHKKTNISDAETWWGLSSHVYQYPEFFGSQFILSPWKRRTYNNFVASLTKCNRFFGIFVCLGKVS